MTSVPVAVVSAMTISMENEKFVTLPEKLGKMI